MSARSQLKDLLTPGAPDTWEIFDYPTSLRSFDDPAKSVAVVIEQRTVEASPFSPDEDGIPIGVDLVVWVVVDGTRGDDLPTIEDALEDAAETMIRLLEPLHGEAWDGTATRDAYDAQKPAYQFPISAAGRLTPPTESGE